MPACSNDPDSLVHLSVVNSGREGSTLPGIRIFHNINFVVETVSACSFVKLIPTFTVSVRKGLTVFPVSDRFKLR